MATLAPPLELADTPVQPLAKAMFGGELPTELLTPFPRTGPAESRRVAALVRTLRDYADEEIDPARIEEERWIGDKLVRDLADRGLMGLGIPERYGGGGLSMTGYCNMFEAFGAIDMGLALVLGIHQSIGTRGIVEFGTDEQKERFLPDLASGQKLAGFALTEPGAGSDAYNIRSRAVRQPDGSWRLNGEKCFIGNGDKGSVLVTFARAEVGGRDRHVALILEKGMEGLEVGERYDTMGLRANDVRPLEFKDVRVPAENVLGEPGQGFKMATKILENGRLTIAAGATGCAKHLADLMAAQAQERRQFGRPIAEFGAVQDKLAWLVSQLFAVESMTYLTTGMVDRGGLDVSIETALCKVYSTDFLLGAANRALDLRGGLGYMRSEPYERILRDVRIFPIFEGANDVLRAWIGLKGFKAVVERLGGGEQRSAGAEPSLPGLELVRARAERLADRTEALLMNHGEAAAERQLDQHRIARAACEVYAQTAVAARMADEPAGAPSEPVARAFMEWSGARADEALDAIDTTDDAPTAELAALAYAGEAYQHPFRR